MRLSKNIFTLGWTIPLRERRYLMKSLCFAAAEREKVSNRRKRKWGKTALFIISAYFIGVSLLVAHLTRPTPWLEPVYMIAFLSCCDSVWNTSSGQQRAASHSISWSWHWSVITLRLWLCVLQGPLSVTEELHSLNFEAMLMLQGLDIDLEVCFSVLCNILYYILYIKYCILLPYTTVYNQKLI